MEGKGSMGVFWAWVLGGVKGAKLWYKWGLEGTIMTNLWDELRGLDTSLGISNEAKLGACLRQIGGNLGGCWAGCFLEKVLGLFSWYLKVELGNVFPKI